jgi:hypothetical protein
VLENLCVLQTLPRVLHTSALLSYLFDNDFVSLDKKTSTWLLGGFISITYQCTDFVIETLTVLEGGSANLKRHKEIRDAKVTVI